ncbi:MAG TPA: hypothetical protein VGE39_06850, partial [Prosthecobacter sp.]
MKIFPVARLLLALSVSLGGSLLRAQAPAAKAPAPAAVAKEPVLVLKAVTDRADALYKVGETATFTIEATLDGKPLKEGKAV